MGNTNNIAVMIKKKALELGYEACGIIKADEMKGYADRLEENSRIFPELKEFYARRLHPYALPQQGCEWAKSIVICINRYGKYKLPAKNGDHVGKVFWFDSRRDKNTEEYRNRGLFDNYLTGLGLKTSHNIHPGTTAYRWAAQKAGLGIIRKNNFFYTKNGSWVVMETWLIDQEMELIDTPDLKPCPEGCSNCREACKTSALAKPYATNMLKCIACLNHASGELPPETLRDKMGKWIYGCDDCQNACPMNKNCWQEEKDFPNLNEVAEYMSFEKIFALDDETMEKIIIPKFWYIRKESSWQWKINSIIAMTNNFEAKYEKHLRHACGDKNEKVREAADWACAKLFS